MTEETGDFAVSDDDLDVAMMALRVLNNGAEPYAPSVHRAASIVAAVREQLGVKRHLPVSKEEHARRRVVAEAMWAIAYGPRKAPEEYATVDLSPVKGTPRGRAVADKPPPVLVIDDEDERRCAQQIETESFSAMMAVVETLVSASDSGPSYDSSGSDSSASYDSGSSDSFSGGGGDFGGSGSSGDW